MPKEKETFAEFEARMAREEEANAGKAQDVTSVQAREMLEAGAEAPDDEDEGSGDEGEDEGSGDEGEDEGSGDEGEDEGSGDEGEDEGSGDEGSELSVEEQLKRKAGRLRRKLEKERALREEAEAAARARENARHSDADDDNDDDDGAQSADGEAPRPDDFEYGELDSEYIKAVARHEGRKAFFDAQKEAAAAAAAQEAEQRRLEAKARFTKLVLRGDEEFDDFEEVVIKNAPNYKLSKDFLDLAIADKYKAAGHKVLYHLAKNPAEAERIAGLTPSEQGVEFVELYSRFSPPKREKSETSAADTQPKRTAPSASEPPSRRARGSGGLPRKNVSKMSFAEFEAHIAAQDAANKR